DDEAQVAGGDVDVHAADRDVPVEHHPQVADAQSLRHRPPPPVRRRSSPASGARPPGRNATGITKSNPSKYVHADGHRSGSAAFAHTTATAPSAGPTRLARPPTATPMTHSMDGTTPI